MTSPPSLLLVMPDFPFPADHGGRSDLWGRLLALQALGVKADAVISVKAQPSRASLARVTQMTRQHWIIPRSYAPTRALSRMPFQVASRSRLAAVRLTRRYDIVWLDSQYVWPILSNPTLEAETIAVRINNEESRYYRELAASSRSWRRLFYRFESAKFARLWPQVLNASQGRLYFASREEWEEFQAGQEREHHRRPPAARAGAWLPPPLSLDEMQPPPAGKPGQVLFVGSLFSPNNVHGLLWYLEEIQPRITWPGYNLVVAGNGRGASLRQLERAAGRCQNVRVVISPSSQHLRDLYASSQVFINPMRHGAGITLKTLHALLAGLPVVTTTVGARGSSLRAPDHFLLADEPIAFAQAVTDLLAQRGLAMAKVENAQVQLRADFNHAGNLRHLFETSLAPRLS